MRSAAGFHEVMMPSSVVADDRVGDATLRHRAKV
jgi:hypothetical protein